jgi:bacterioferritin
MKNLPTKKFHLLIVAACIALLLVPMSVQAQLENDLAGETDAVKNYNESVAICAAAGDNGTRELFEKMVKDEEQHADYLEAGEKI